jgi:uncharacterized membrane protein YbhN (UPF0104 family)
MEHHADTHSSKHPAARISVTVIVLLLFALEIALIAPHLRGTGAALAHIRWQWLGLAIFAEISSMTYFARLQRRMLRAGGVRVPLVRAVAAALAANAMSVTLPAGPVVSSGYTFRRMRAWGASGPLATWGMVASGALSTIALAVIGIFGSGLASGHRPNVPLVVGEVILAVAVGISLRRLMREPDLLMKVGSWALTKVNRVMRRPVGAGQARIRELVEELVLIRPRTRDWLLGLTFAILNWVADLVCLIAACRAVGAHGPTLAVAFVTYAAGMAASSLPLLPGGIGVVDGTLILALTRGGLPASLATAGVVIYRLVSFVLIAALGWGAWFLIRRSDRREAAAIGESPVAPTVTGGQA